MIPEKKYRVLVVDDEASVLMTYQLILEREGYEVVACSTATDAIAAVEAQLFDAVLCDYSLEEQRTGFEVVTVARARDPKVPAALLTGYATKETAEEAAARDIRVMFKPIEIDEFLATTSTMLRRNHESDEEGREEAGGPAQSAEQGRSGPGSGADRTATASPRKD